LAIQAYWKGIQERYHFLSHDTEHPILAPEELYQNEESFFSLLKPFARVFLDSPEKDVENPYFSSPPEVAVIRRNKDPILQLKQYFRESKHRILICADSPGRREAIKQLLDESMNHDSKDHIHVEAFSNIPEFLVSEQRIGMVVAPLFDGFISKHQELTVLTE
jgi:transcription-repair coupling factor (superfamily II helicase)